MLPPCFVIFVRGDYTMAAGAFQLLELTKAQNFAMLSLLSVYFLRGNSNDGYVQERSADPAHSGKAPAQLRTHRRPGDEGADVQGVRDGAARHHGLEQPCDRQDGPVRAAAPGTLPVHGVPHGPFAREKRLQPRRAQAAQGGDQVPRLRPGRDLRDGAGRGPRQRRPRAPRRVLP